MQQPAKPAMPLTMAGDGQRLNLIAIAGDARQAHRLTEMGLAPGVELVVVQGDGSTLLIAIGDTRLALGRGLAQRVLVTPICGRRTDHLPILHTRR